MNIICPLCKGRSVKRAYVAPSKFSNRSYDLWTCKNCIHIFVLTPPNDSEMAAVYKKAYYYEALLAIEEEKRWRFRKILKRIKRFVPLNARIIDVGCMGGTNLEMLRNAGYSNLSGIEMDAAMVEKCKNKRLNVFEGTFSQWANSGVDRSNKNSACFVLSHVVEHIRNISTFFDEMNNFLKSGDYLVIMLPNSRAFTTSLFGRYWGWWTAPLHLHNFSQKSISNLLYAKGFSIDSIFTKGADSLFFLSSLASFLGMRSGSRKISLLQEITINISSFILKYWFFIGNEEMIVVAKKNSI